MACFGDGFVVVSNTLQLSGRAVSVQSATSSLTGSLVGATVAPVLAVDSSPNSMTIVNSDPTLGLVGAIFLLMEVDASTTDGATTTGAIEQGLCSGDVWNPGVSTGGPPTFTKYIRMPALRSVGTYGEKFAIVQTYPIPWTVPANTTHTFNFRAGISAPAGGNHAWNLDVGMRFVGAHI